MRDVGNWLFSNDCVTDWDLLFREFGCPTSAFSAYITESLFSDELRELIGRNENTDRTRLTIIDALNRGMVNNVFYDPVRIPSLNMLDARAGKFVVNSGKQKNWILVKANHIVLASQFPAFFRSRYSRSEAIWDSIDAVINRVDRRWKIETSKFRITPSFLIAGVQRCGTSSLFYYLSQHADIASPEQKELHFFNRSNYSGDMRHYYSFFPLRSLFNKRSISGEATPEYSFYPCLMRRIQQVLPNIKLILLVRDPVQRAISHYCAQSPHRRPKSLHDAIRLDDHFFGARDILNFIEQDPYRCGQNYISRGRYIDYIPFIYQSFPKQNILLLKAEDMFADPLGVVNVCCEFLEIDQFMSLRSENFTDSNRQSAHLLRSLQSLPDPVSEEIKEELYDYFHPYNQRFYEFIQRDMKWGK